MSENQKPSILELRDKDHWSFKKIGELYDISAAAARERYHRQKREANRPAHWTDALSVRARNCLIAEFWRDPMESISKEKIVDHIKAGTLMKIPNLGKGLYKEICDYLGVNPDEESRPKLQPVTTIFLIEKLWIDESENELGKAMGYASYGFMTNEKKANAYVRTAGFKKGTGWPIPEGQEVPVMKMTRVKRID